MALLMPAMQKVREMANRTTCQNNLRHVGLALQNYRSGHRAFPPAGTTTPHAHSWAAYLLPLVDQPALAKQYKWDASWYENRLVTTQVKVFQCPSTPVPRFESGTTNEIAWLAATTDYVPPREVDPRLVSS